MYQRDREQAWDELLAALPPRWVCGQVVREMARCLREIGVGLQRREPELKLDSAPAAE